MMIKKIIKWIFNSLTDKSISLRNNKSISKDEIYKILRKKGLEEIYLSDDYYYLIKDSQLFDFLKRDITDLKQYVSNRYDCDDYAFTLMGKASSFLSPFAIGIVWVKVKGKSLHALNFYITEDKEFKYIEPQNDKVFKENSDYEPFFAIV